MKVVWIEFEILLFSQCSSRGEIGVFGERSDIRCDPRLTKLSTVSIFRFESV